ncbi:hypothetical protein [Clostridium saccharoperbutylacetonicum]
MSNTSKGFGEKGSKHWMQILVNLDKGKALKKEIQKKGFNNRRYNLDFTIRRI